MSMKSNPDFFLGTKPVLLIAILYHFLTYLSTVAGISRG